jgi:hypothetical protein
MPSCCPERAEIAAPHRHHKPVDQFALQLSCAGVLAPPQRLAGHSPRAVDPDAFNFPPTHARHPPWASGSDRRPGWYRPGENDLGCGCAAIRAQAGAAGVRRRPPGGWGVLPVVAEALGPRWPFPAYPVISSIARRSRPGPSGAMIAAAMVPSMVWRGIHGCRTGGAL